MAPNILETFYMVVNTVEKTWEMFMEMMGIDLEVED